MVAVSSTSASTDLSDAAQLGPAVTEGHYVNIISSVDCYLKFAETNAETAAADATTGANRSDWLPAGVKESFVIPPGCPHFVRVSADPGFVRISVSSRPWPEWHRSWSPR